jgi:hypothetical protein
MKSLVIFVFIFAHSLAFAAGNSSLLNQPQENQAREFVMSCTYGVMAGTLVGAASLAFTSKPSDNLNRVARGASIGLYLGIALGLYVVYIVPGLEEEAAEQDPVARLPFMLSPTFALLNGHERLDGVKADMTVMRF